MTRFPKLDAFIRSRISGLSGEMSCEPVSGGQSNPTFFITYGNRRLVLRKKPDGVVLPSAHAIDREYRVLDALIRVGLPVPQVLLFHERNDVVGSPFYIMERIEGRIFSDSELAAAPQTHRKEMYASVAKTLSAIHSVDYESAGLSRFGKHGDFFARQIARWTRQWSLSRTRELPEIEFLVEWLLANCPGETQTTLVHGDFRIGNLIFHPTDPTVVGVLDWELSTLGHPMVDLAHTCVYSWYIRPEEYGGILGLDLGGKGLPGLSEFCRTYYSFSSSTERLGVFHMVLALFRNTVIFEGIAARALAGNANSDNAATVGNLAPIFAKRATEVIEQGESGLERMQPLLR